jgi:hypothetical protein
MKCLIILQLHCDVLTVLNYYILKKNVPYSKSYFIKCIIYKYVEFNDTKLQNY